MLYHTGMPATTPIAEAFPCKHYSLHAMCCGKARPPTCSSCLRDEQKSMYPDVFFGPPATFAGFACARVAFPLPTFPGSGSAAARSLYLCKANGISLHGACLEAACKLCCRAVSDKCRITYTRFPIVHHNNSRCTHSSVSSVCQDSTILLQYLVQSQRTLC